MDARDVAQALILAAEKGRRGDRYLPPPAATRPWRSCLRSRKRERRESSDAADSNLDALSARCASGILGPLDKEAGPAQLGRSSLTDARKGRTQFNHEKSERELGLRFRPVEETLRDEIAWYRSNGWLPKISG